MIKLQVLSRPSQAPLISCLKFFNLERNIAYLTDGRNSDSFYEKRVKFYEQILIPAGHARLSISEACWYFSEEVVALIRNQDKDFKTYFQVISAMNL